LRHEVLNVKSRARVDSKAPCGLVCLVARKNREKKKNENKRTRGFHKELIFTQYLHLSQKLKLIEMNEFNHLINTLTTYSIIHKLKGKTTITYQWFFR
jgi:hypothetical protein